MMSLSPESSARSITFDSLWPEQPGICRLRAAHELFVLVVPGQSRTQSLRCPCAAPAFFARDGLWGRDGVPEVFVHADFTKNECAFADRIMRSRHLDDLQKERTEEKLNSMIL